MNLEEQGHVKGIKDEGLLEKLGKHTFGTTTENIYHKKTIIKPNA